jgi:hypothetical protein
VTSPKGLTPRARRKVRCGPHRTLFLASRSSFAERLELDMGYTAAPQLTGAIVFNVAINTDVQGTGTPSSCIPMRLQRRGGRKRIVAPDGSQIVPTSKPRPDSTLVKALARAWRWQRMLDEGGYGSVIEISNAEGISKSYVSRILRLALLAPDIVDALLAGKTDQGVMLDQIERPLPASWEEQRGLLDRLTRR